MDLNKSIRNSALWAAYGDAIGFISELATPAMLKQRAGITRLETTVPWNRRIGGKFGVNITLPAGSYSDDTQLRLSVSRAIGAKGFFDVEAFAKVELPIWTNYSLGAGRGSKCAALNISKRSAAWNNNFFVSDDLTYVNMGGNGAAMRIQPHVWSYSPLRDKKLLIRDIIRDSITTHGHMRGILGAVFHGLSLLHALQKKKAPYPRDWYDILQEILDIPKVIREDDQLSYVWLPLWESLSKKNLEDECLTVVNEIERDINNIRHFLIDRELAQYHDIAVTIDAFKAENKGSAVKTAILANALAYLSNGNPEKAVITAANEIGSDTDTIATMAGAIAGAVCEREPSGKLMDYEYIVAEADRMFRIGQGVETKSFVYPDLLSWNSPANQIDVLVTTPNGMTFSAFGKVTPRENAVAGETSSTIWQWFDSNFGQTFLIKHRHNLKYSEADDRNHDNKYRTSKSKQESSQDDLFSNVTNAMNIVNKEPRIKKPINMSRDITVDTALDIVIKSGFDSRILGEMFLKILASDDNIERCIAFSALVAKAKLARRAR